MDDYTSNVLIDSKNEWSILLINHITPHIIDGFRSIFNESVRLCEENDEIEKYLMTYQNLLARIPKWNQLMITTEHERIVKLCNCSYLEDILTCVHIIQLKVLSCVRVGNESKKIKIDIPDFSTFLHNVYTNIARKLYSAIYLFEIDVPALEQQKRNREFELIVQTCIMNTIRDRIPVEMLLRQFIDETQEVEVTKVEKLIETKPLEEPKPIEQKAPTNTNNNMNFNDMNINNDEMPSFFRSSKMNEPPKMNESLNSFNEPVRNVQPPKMNEIPNSFNETPNFQQKISSFNPPNKVGFTGNDSVLTFESTNDMVSLGDELPTNSLGIEELDMSSEPIKLEFEEL
jgi:hypothetical protein